MRIKILNDNGHVWCVQVGDEEKPVAKFFDCRYEHTDLGQFVSSYYVDTLLEDHGGGLDLMGYEPTWKISAAGMDRVRNFLRICPFYE